MKKLLLSLTIVFAFMLTSTYAALELNNIQFDPAVIGAGDEIDIIIEYEAKNLPFDDSLVGNRDYSYRIELKGDDDMTQEYITILDSQGDFLGGSVLSGQTYNKVFRIKVASNAIPANYQFKLEGQWYKDGTPVGAVESKTFMVPVKKEGITLEVSSFQTTPSQIRPGDDFIELTTTIDNVGFKDAKSLSAQLSSTSSGIEPSYANNNRISIGGLGESQSKPASFYINLDEDLQPGVHNLSLNMEYLDRDNNQYQKTIELPLLVKSRPHLEIINYTGTGLAGDEGQLKVWVKNTGLDDAESVDVRIVKQSMQPFAFDLRSDYIGEIKPSQTGVAVFNFKILDDAEFKEHNFKLLLRAKGDSDEGDTSVYTFQRSAQFDVTGKATNWYVIAGLGALTILIVFVIISKIGGRKK